MNTETKATPATETSLAANPPSAEAPPPMNITPSSREALKVFEREIATYRRELPRLLEKGEVGRHALIKGDQILSIWDTWRDATQVGLELFGPDAPMFIKAIDPRDLHRFAHLDAWMAAQCQS